MTASAGALQSHLLTRPAGAGCMVAIQGACQEGASRAEQGASLLTMLSVHPSA
jgi:hypothetical protein